MFGDWNDEEWCQFDNYMIQCLQLYLEKGLMKSEFVNLKIRKLSAETCHEFIEWCGVIGDNPIHDKLKVGGKIPKNELYTDFVEDNPDFAPKSKMSVSRVRFSKWLVAFSLYHYGCAPEEGRDMHARWIRFRHKSELDEQQDFPF